MSGLAVAGIWVCVVLAIIFSPDMVTGTQHDHLQMAYGDVLWAAIATGAVAGLTLSGLRARATDRMPWIVLGVGTALIWLGVLLASVFAPVMVTGTDPTELPLVVIVAPIFGAIATGLLTTFVRTALSPAVETPVVVPAAFITTANGNGHMSAGPAAQLRELAQLRDSGVITQEDYEKKKEELLARI